MIALGIGQLWYDHNLLNMQAAGLESVRAGKAPAAAERLQRLVRRVGRQDPRGTPGPQGKVPRTCRWSTRCKEIVSYFPQDTEAKRPIIERIHARLANLPESVPPIPVVPPAELDGALARLGQMAAMGPPHGRGAGPRTDSATWSAACRSRSTTAGCRPSSRRWPRTCWGGCGRPARRRQSRAAAVERPARGPRRPLRRPARLLTPCRSTPRPTSGTWTPWRSSSARCGASIRT